MSDDKAVTTGRSGPLSGLRVVDCSRGISGPRASGLLADYGADVLWIEPPGGDPYRDTLTAAYSVFNRGKRSLVLDLGDQNARTRLDEVLGSADVFLQSWRPGVADKLSLSYDDVHARHPHLVYTSISGFGPDVAHAETAGYDALVHAVVGLDAEQAGHRAGPVFPALPFASMGASYLALIGTLAALYRRNLDGRGRHVETSLLDGVLAYLSMYWGITDQPEVPFLTTFGKVRFVLQSHRCADDEYIGIHTGARGAFGRLMVLLGLDDRIPPSESGLDMGLPLPPEHKAIMDVELPRILASKPRSVWLQQMIDADVCAIPHLRPGEMFDAPQVRHNDMVVTVDDPELGPVEQVGLPVKFGSPLDAPRPAPRIGEHSEHIDREWDRQRRGLNVDPDRAGGPEPALLDGVKVLDFGAYYAGPYASRLLADLGADVIKLEPVSGDQLRGFARNFRSAQAGKRSVAMDMKDPDAGAVAADLLRWADVVQHNLRPGAAERVGLGYDHAVDVNPAVIYLHAPGWGSSGPTMDRQTFAPLVSGYTGASFETGGRSNPPIYPVANEDAANGMLGAVGMLIALLRRQADGHGQLMISPQLNAAMTHMAHVVRTADGTVLGAGRLDARQLGTGPLERLYETADGWICVVVASDEEFERLCDALAADELRDARFASTSARAANASALADMLSAAFATRTTANVIAALTNRRVPATEVAGYNNRAFMDDPSNLANGRVAECVHPEEGLIRELALLVRVSGAAAPPHRLAPNLGEHTDAVLASFGYSDERIQSMRARGVVQ